MRYRLLDATDMDYWAGRAEAWKALSDLPYKPNRDAYKAAVAEIKTIGDYRSAMVKEALVGELPLVLSQVANRTLSNVADARQKLAEGEARSAERARQHALSAERAALWARVTPHREEYVRGFDSVSEGIRAWGCLEALVLDGTVRDFELVDYGIHLDEE